MLYRHCLVVITVVALTCSVQANIIFVDDDAPLGGDGLSWDRAYQFLQDAFANAVGGTEIRVAQGVYTPDRDEAGNVIPGDPSATFQLISDVSLMGGYAGFGAPDPDARDIGLYETILSGDLLGDDGPDFQDNEDNSYHIMRAADLLGVHVDGFTITAGNAYAPSVGVYANGAGMRIRDSMVTVSHCRFTGNSAEGDGGGVAAYDSDVVFTGCTMQHNRALRPINGGGGALWANDCDVALVDCDIIDNVATGIGGGLIIAAFDEATEFTMINCRLTGNSADFGGGLTLHYVIATVINCTIADNEALNHTYGLGGGVQQNDAVSLLMINSLVTDNFSAVRGGGIYVSGQLTMVNCTVARNTAELVGGGIEAQYGVTGSVRNSILWGNSAAGLMNEAAQIDLGETEVVSVDFSCVQGLTGMLGGTGNIDADPLFVDPDNGDLRLSTGSPCIDAGDDTAVPEGVLRDLDGNPRFIADACAGDRGATVDMGAYEFQGTSCDLSNTMAILAAWGRCDNCGTPQACPADFDGDCSVGIFDLLIRLGTWD